MIGTFRKRLWDRETLLGSMVSLPMPAIAEILADAGFDWLFLDGEHGPLGTGEILAILQAVGDRVACIVRVPGSEEAPIKKILDQGAEGIIVPQVNTADQAACVVRYARTRRPARAAWASAGRTATGCGSRSTWIRPTNAWP